VDREVFPELTITREGLPNLPEELVFVQDLSHGEVTKLRHKTTSNSVELNHEVICLNTIS
jgi:hypothetical protein